jgi:ATP-dependent Clp protease protease subunit
MDNSELLLKHGLNVETRTIRLIGEVNEALYSRLILGLDRLRDVSSDPVIVELTSYGGDTYVGLAMYDAIISTDMFVRVHVKGPAMSMGAVLLQAGDRRVADASAIIMVHYGFDVNESGTQARINRAVDKRVRDIFQRRTKKSARTINAWHNADTYFTAADALKAGLLDEVIGG